MTISFYHDEQELRSSHAGQPESVIVAAINDSWDSFVWNIHEYIQDVKNKRLHVTVVRPQGDTETITTLPRDADEILNLFNFYPDFAVDATQQDDLLVLVVDSEGKRTVFIITGAKP